MPTITALTADDHDDWLALWWGYLEFYEADLSTAQTDLTFRRIIDPDGPIHGAIARNEQGSAIGLVHWLTHVATWSAGPYCYLEDLFVHPDARRTGTGEALIEHVRSWAGQNECAKVYWLTQDHNHTARRLYDRVATPTGFVHYETAIES
jgi:GNAT superfamily N-acetyltransferase